MTSGNLTMDDVQDFRFYIPTLTFGYEGNLVVIANFVESSSTQDVEECRRYTSEWNSGLSNTCGNPTCDVDNGFCRCYYRDSAKCSIISECDVGCVFQGLLTYGVFHRGTVKCVSCIRKTRIEEEETANIKPARR